MAWQFSGEEDFGVSEGSSASKEPSSSVIAVADFLTLSHFTKTLMPETKYVEHRKFSYLRLELIKSVNESKLFKFTDILLHS